MKKHTHTHTHTHPSTTLRGWSPWTTYYSPPFLNVISGSVNAYNTKKHKQLKTLLTPPTYITVGEQNF